VLGSAPDHHRLDHASAAARLREAYRQRTPSPVTSEVAHRDLSDYDRVFGLIDDDVAADEAV